MVAGLVAPLNTAPRGHTFRQVGGAVAIAVFGALIANPDRIDLGLRLSLGTAALLHLLAALSSLRIRPRADSAT